MKDTWWHMTGGLAYSYRLCHVVHLIPTVFQNPDLGWNPGTAALCILPVYPQDRLCWTLPIPLWNIKKYNAYQVSFSKKEMGQLADMCCITKNLTVMGLPFLTTQTHLTGKSRIFLNGLSCSTLRKSQLQPWLLPSSLQTLARKAATGHGPGKWPRL